MASRLYQLAAAARAIPPTPFRSGATQLSDAMDAIVSRSFSVPPKSSEAALNKRAESLSTTEQAAVDSALAAVDRINEASALKTVSGLSAGCCDTACSVPPLAAAAPQ